MTKICPKCCESKSISDFYKCKKNLDGLQAYCKTCIKLANKLWADNNKEKFKGYSKKFSETEGRQKYLAEYKRANRDYLLAKSKKYKEDNHLAIKVAAAEYRKHNKDKIREASRKYSENNKPSVLESSRRYREDNRPKYALYRSLRRARGRLAQPSWLTEEDKLRMELFWKLRELKSFVTGIDHEVDHIVPLQGATVCGLHVPWNLQVITKVENRKKGARSWPNMWES